MRTCIASVFAGMLLALITQFVAASPAQAATETMSTKGAGAFLLTQVCRANRANAKVSNALPFRADGRFRAVDMKGERLQRVRRALAVASDMFYVSGRNLLHPPNAWPDDVAGKVGRFTDNTLAISFQFDAQRNAGPRDAFVRRWNNKIYPLFAPGSKAAGNAPITLEWLPGGWYWT